MRKHPIIYCLILLIASACDKGELPIDPREPGDIITGQVEMLPDYRYQLYYDLGTNSVVGQNVKTAWDIGLESAVDGWHVTLNTAKGGAVADMGAVDFESVMSSAGVDWIHDAHSGNLDSTAIGDHRELAHVYIIDRGYDWAGVAQGFEKMMIMDVSDSHFILRHAALDGSNEHTTEVAKDAAVSMTCFSFESSEAVTIEPAKEDWDLYFGQYTYLFTDPVQAYLVTGVLSNRHEVQVKEIEGFNFDDIVREDVENLELETNIEEIGYDWKFYDFDTGSFLVDIERVFIIRDTEGLLYKLRFIDFYNENGDKGAPKFEVQLL